jgi:hypothetical protein
MPAPTALTPFRLDVPEADLDDLRRRLLATRWPERETVGDTSQGPQLASSAGPTGTTGVGRRRC